MRKPDLNKKPKEYKEAIIELRDFKKHVREMIEDSCRQHCKSVNEMTKSFYKIEKKINEYNEEISSMKRIMESAEENLLNVLLAIRQNEYLQAWYPAQEGYPEMKVTGKHPCSK